MTRRPSPLIMIIAVMLAVLGGRAISAQDKYTVQVPNGLAFSEFRGYEDWPVIAISENEGLIAVIVGNPAMIDAYKEGVPDNGKPFPDGARMAKIHWIPKKQEAYPGPPTVPGAQHDVDFMVKDSKRFADSGGWGYAVFDYNAASRRIYARHDGGLAAAGQRRQVRVRVPHESEGEGLRLHGVREALNCADGLCVTDHDAMHKLLQTPVSDRDTLEGLTQFAFPARSACQQTIGAAGDARIGYA